MRSAHWRYNITWLSIATTLTTSIWVRGTKKPPQVSGKNANPAIGAPLLWIYIHTYTNITDGWIWIYTHPLARWNNLNRIQCSSHSHLIFNAHHDNVFIVGSAHSLKLLFSKQVLNRCKVVVLGKVCHAYPAVYLSLTVCPQVCEACFHCYIQPLQVRSMSQGWNYHSINAFYVV